MSPEESPQSLEVGPGGLRPTVGFGGPWRPAPPSPHWGADTSGVPCPASRWGRAEPGIPPSPQWGGMGSGVPGLWRPHLHHIHEVAEADRLVDGEVAVAVQHTVVDDVTAEAHAQHVVARVPRGLSHQEQPVLGRLQLLHSLLA